MQSRRRRYRARMGKVISEPRGGMFRHLLQFSRLLKEMGGARNDDEFLRAAKFAEGHPVEFLNRVVKSAHDQECRRGDTLQSLTGKIGSSSARDNGMDIRSLAGRGNECGRSSRARPKVPDGESLGMFLIFQPSCGVSEPFG